MAFHLPKVIGLVGPAGCGKSTTARLISSTYGYNVVPFAKPLKDMIRALGLSEEEVNGSLKEKPMALFNGKSPRELMQTLGTQWGRECVASDIWIRLWLFNTEGRRAIVDDVRFPNEVAAIYRRDGITLRIERPDVETTNHNQHASEQALRDYRADYTISNAGTLVDLRHEVERVLKEYSYGVARTTETFTAGYAAEAGE